jgi:hypothetical protein
MFLLWCLFHHLKNAGSLVYWGISFSHDDKEQMGIYEYVMCVRHHLIVQSVAVYCKWLPKSRNAMNIPIHNVKIGTFSYFGSDSAT